MQTQYRPQQKTALLSDDGELRVELPLVEFAPWDDSLNKRKKNDVNARRSTFKSPAFWAISIGFTITSYAALIPSFQYSIILMIIIGGMAGTIKYWRRNRHIALGFLGGMVATLIIVPTILIAIVYLLLAVL